MQGGGGGWGLVRGGLAVKRGAWGLVISAVRGEYGCEELDGAWPWVESTVGEVDGPSSRGLR